ncbi:MAG: ferritin-like domain-containing protein [Candidatus Microthrix sp.]|uniref:Ferritin-like domain-containing protein n=1 Tax=Candidatus Neomicrothrix subdominans TaxID=2954438 RepID=A0A936NDQ8_9ACTN|nr:ferritin-like domain-containing protein [Candidatus Microthrix subdominans]
MNPNLGALITDTLSDSRWDLTYLGMQIMVEGLALAAFGAMHHTTSEPLLKRLLRYVMSDEARHVAFGVLTLREYYEGLSDAELRERQEFTFESAERLRNRFFMVDVWERMGVDPRKVLKLIAEHPPPAQTMFQQLLFSKIVPNTKKLGLLDASGGWLRRRFEELGVIEFEDWWTPPRSTPTSTLSRRTPRRKRARRRPTPAVPSIGCKDCDQRGHGGLR